MSDRPHTGLAIGSRIRRVYGNRHRYAQPLRSLLRLRRSRRWLDPAPSGYESQHRRPCVVGVPMMNFHELTARLVEDLDFEDFDELVIYDHGSDNPDSVAWLAEIEHKDKVIIDRRAAIPQESLYRSWNDTVRRALARFDAPEIDVVLLNNDVRLPAGFVSFVTAALRSGDPGVWITYPDSSASLAEGLPKAIRLTPTKGLAAEGGLSGWAFAIKAELFKAELPYIDERLRFYSGDRDLVHNVETRGHYAARVDGLPCEHGLGVTRKQRPELQEQMRRDIEFWWGQRGGQAE